MSAKVSVIVFDVNETLLDIESLNPIFARLFGDERVMREWFAQLVLYSQAITLSKSYVSFSELAGGILRMIGARHSVPIGNHDVEELRRGVGNMPAHPEVAQALSRLNGAGFRLATLTNSPPSIQANPLERTGLDRFFEQMFSVHEVRRFKPVPETYRHVAGDYQCSNGLRCDRRNNSLDISCWKRRLRLNCGQSLLIFRLLARDLASIEDRGALKPVHAMALVVPARGTSPRPFIVPDHVIQ